MLLGPVRSHLEEELGVKEEIIHKLDMPEKLKKKIFGEPPSKV